MQRVRVLVLAQGDEIVEEGPDGAGEVRGGDPLQVDDPHVLVQAVALGDRGAALDVIERLHDLHPVHHRESLGEARALEPFRVDVDYPLADDGVAELVASV